MTGFDFCRCRDACLAAIGPDDDLRLTDIGYALVDHLDGSSVYPQESLFDIGQAAS